MLVSLVTSDPEPVPLSLHDALPVSVRDCLAVCKLLWPYTVVKTHDIEKVIDHYEPDIQDLDDNVVDLTWYKKWIKNDR